MDPTWIKTLVDAGMAPAALVVIVAVFISQKRTPRRLDPGDRGGSVLDELRDLRRVLETQARATEDASRDARAAEHASEERFRTLQEDVGRWHRDLAMRLDTYQQARRS